MKTWFEYDRATGAVLRQFRLPEDMSAPVSEDGHGVIESDEPLTPGMTAFVINGAVQISNATPPTPTLDDLKADRWSLARNYRDKIMEGTCRTPSGRIDTDDDSQRKINGAATAAFIAKSDAQPFSVDWTMADNSVVTLDADGMIAVGMAVVTYLNACQMVGTAIRDQIDAAADADALAAIDITAGYPS